MDNFVAGQTVILTQTSSPKEKAILGRPLTILRRATGYQVVCKCEGIPGAWWLDPNHLKSVINMPQEQSTSKPETFSEVPEMQLQTMDEWQFDQWSRTHS